MPILDDEIHIWIKSFSSTLVYGVRHHQPLVTLNGACSFLCNETKMQSWTSDSGCLLHSYCMSTEGSRDHAESVFSCAWGDLQQVLKMEKNLETFDKKVRK